jgi:flavin-dependent dehydrogenase
VVLERGSYDQPRPGESLGALVQSLLESLGAWDELRAEVGLAVPFRGVHSAWGSDELAWRSAMTNPLGEGMHVDRSRFDEKLAAFAERAGAEVRRGSGACTVIRDGDGFHVRPATGEAARARFFVDASGRGAPASASAGAGRRWLAIDRLVAVSARVALRREVVGDTELLIEAAEDGWWYSAPQPDGRMVVVLLTDADLATGGGRATLPDRFAAALARTVYTHARAGNVALTPEAIRVVRADSGRLLPDRAAGFRAVGDAAMACDPLGGNGVARALRSALDAAPAIDAALDGAPQSTAPDRDLLVEYLDLRARYYHFETRWPASPFWARRRPIDYKSAPLELAPTAVLRRTPKPTTREALAPVEALIPPRALTRLLTALETPRPAHQAMQLLRSAAPIGDKRLLVGLQLLVKQELLGPA